MTKVRRILLTADTIGGVWNYAIELAGALAPHGIEIVLATMGRTLSRDQRREVSRTANLDLRESTFRLEWMEEPWNEVDEAGEWLLDLAHETEPDLIHLNGYAHGALNWDVPVVVVAHSCVGSWWRAVRGESLPPSFDEYRRRVAAGLNGADLLVAPTEAMLSALWDSAPFDPAKQRLIRNGRGSQYFRSGKKEPMIFGAGRVWDEAKNLALLDKIAPGLSWPVFIAGDACGPEGTAAQISRTHLLGSLSQPELAAYLSKASLFAAPARYEPFGLSILEAGMSGCALLLGDIQSLRELWDGAALFLSPDEPDQWQAAIESLISNPARCTEMREKAKQRSSLFSSQRMGAQYLAAYEELIGSTSATPAPTLMPA